jgi:hypothetical protein
MIGFTGDIALSGIINDFSEERIKDQLSLGKISVSPAFIINLEAPVSGAGGRPEKERGINLCTSPLALKAFLKHNNIIAVTLANNHSHDYGEAGLRETIEILDSFKVHHTGAGFRPAHLEPSVFAVNNTRYALLGYVHPDTNPYIKTGLYLNIYDRKAILTAIRGARLLADHVIVSLHWGKDYSAFPLSWQLEDAHEFIDAGADVIVGHHPHVIQPFEQYKGKYIFYSLGSAIFGDFYLHDRLRALPVKTKRSFIPLFKDLITKPDLAGIREKRGNVLILESRNFESWSEKMMKRSKNKSDHRFCRLLSDIKEAYADRIYDLLFGYYRNPIKDIFSPHAISNGLRIIRKKN